MADGSRRRSPQASFQPSRYSRASRVRPPRLILHGFWLPCTTAPNACPYPFRSDASAARRTLLGGGLADMTLQGADREIFEAIMLLYGGLQSQRADIAHGIFGFIPKGEEDAIPWIETKNLSKDWVERFHKPKPENSAEQSDEKLAQKRVTYIYKLSDLERLETEIRELWLIAFSFTSYLNSPGLPLVTKALEMQCALPQMVQALFQVRSQKNNPPPAQ